ncbi:hypothetical protein Ancab_023614 [Ancistrocladus abbreviatus]
MEEERKLLRDVFGGSSESNDDEQPEPPLYHSLSKEASILSAEGVRKLLRDVFGGSSESEDDEQRELPLYQSMSKEASILSISNRNCGWEQIKEINGLWLCKDFLSPEQQSFLLSALENEGWFTEESHNQAMRFGDLPLWAIELSNSIHEVASNNGNESEVADFTMENPDHDDEACILPSHLLWREPFFDQLIANVYQPGEGICAHVDLMRFEDGIAIISLESSCVMHFSLEDGEEVPPRAKLPVYLTPGSLLIMWGDARYRWKHEINRKPGFQVWEGQDIDQKKRTSITLRKLRRTE